jgi:hypothetical protein
MKRKNPKEKIQTSVEQQADGLFIVFSHSSGQLIVEGGLLLLMAIVTQLVRCGTVVLLATFVLI